MSKPGRTEARLDTMCCPQQHKMSAKRTTLDRCWSKKWLK